MALHQDGQEPEAALNYIYAGATAEHVLPKYRMPEHCSDPRVIYNLVRDELFLDGNSRQNLATFCTTFVDDEVRPLMDLSVDKNMIDKDEYPQAAEIEKRCVHILADLWNAPRAIAKLGSMELVYDGRGALPAVCYRLKDPKRAGFTLYDLSERVRMRGWQIASYPLPPQRQDTVVQRILIRRGVSRDMAALLLDDIKRAIEQLQSSPVVNSTAKPTFHHS